MRVVIAYPPLIDKIDAAFHIKGQPCLFAWGNKIYNPMNVAIPEPLHRHEEVHGKQQFDCEGGIEGWWLRYIDDPAFRLEQEIPAHRAEYLALLRKYGDVRNNRRRFLVHTAVRLAAPLYGKMITVSQAKKVLASWLVATLLIGTINCAKAEEDVWACYASQRYQAMSSSWPPCNELSTICLRVQEYLKSHTVEEGRAEGVRLGVPRWLRNRAERCLH